MGLLNEITGRDISGILQFAWLDESVLYCKSKKRK